MDFVEFDITFRNAQGGVIAGIWFRRAAWRISTDHLLAYETKEAAIDAWEHIFDHQTGMRRAQFPVDWAPAPLPAGATTAFAERRRLLREFGRARRASGRVQNRLRRASTAWPDRESTGQTDSASV